MTCTALCKSDAAEETNVLDEEVQSEESNLENKYDDRRVFLKMFRTEVFIHVGTNFHFRKCHRHIK